ncbi:pyruvate dehydrogenase complex transcriptional repressor PdhR [Vibrio sp. SS-MA-C1-2]|uniref:pyruvate dehydrogenase complex transcriptional repressor PdhR n=1 Tax=Vibrio sp. SS-MA-C1-2 TaxID=2908646 RepID=UPI001F3EC526|nr:pyruvate dehydrogenase complex transcriptional repressor PdhR [Vibrio sp. SS-MA-C1-2]UJF20100.1 pyruvate dehydrogenase complex transcriptional repressor PdhR [Vibrio sp. SS-MA-C1-2]
MAYQRIKQRKLSDVIQQKLEQLIVEGALSPGSQLPPERELALRFDVSRPSIREAIQCLEAKNVVVRRQGGGTFVSDSLWPSFTDPLTNLLSDYPDAQLDLLESRHALEGISSYFAALRGTEQDFSQILDANETINNAQASGDLALESKAIVQYLVTVTEAAHNVVLLHIVKSLSPLLEKNVSHNLQSLYRREGLAEKIRAHRANIVKAVISGKPEKARAASHDHLAYIEETLLELDREDSRIERSLRRVQQRDVTGNIF